MSRRIAFALAGGAVLSAAIGTLRGPSNAAAHEPELSRYTYWEDIRPLMDVHCASCHAGGGPAPVNLMRYADAIPWANSIARQVLERRMPPWLPDDGVGSFALARTLDERETNMLVDWAIGLAPEGPVPDVLPEAAAADDALPAARLTLAELVEIPDDVSEAAVCAELVRGADLPEAAAGFALVSGGGGAGAIRRRAALFAGESCETGTPVFTWVVGQGPRLRPAGAYDWIPEGTGLFLRLEYRKGFDTEGYAFRDDVELAVFTANGGAPIETRALEPGSTEIGPASLLAVLPPLDSDAFGGRGGEVFTVDAVAVSGEVTELLRIRRFDRDWTERFAFAEPVRLPAGAALRVSHPGALVDLVRAPLETASAR